MLSSGGDGVVLQDRHRLPVYLFPTSNNKTKAKDKKI